MEDRTPLGHNNQRQMGADALPPGTRLFLESHPQKVAHLSSDFLFGLVGLQNTLACLTAILVPNSNIRADGDTFLGHNQSKAGGSSGQPFEPRI